jgi:PIN domain nuclease of toxin-antitoxin system
VIVVDTHAWIWWATESRGLSAAARRALSETREIGVPAISCLEVAAAVARDRLRLDRDVLAWLRTALALPRVVLLPLVPEIAVAAVDLGPAFPGDPGDRLIVATAAHHRARLVTKDDRLRKWDRARTFW